LRITLTFPTTSNFVTRLLGSGANDNATTATIRCTDSQPHTAVNKHIAAAAFRFSGDVRPSIPSGGLSDRILAAEGHDDTCRSNIRSGTFVPCRCNLREPDDPARVVGIALAFGKFSCPRGFALPREIRRRLARLAETGDGAAVAVCDWLHRNGYLGLRRIETRPPELGRGGQFETSCTALGAGDTAHRCSPPHLRTTAPRISLVHSQGDA
jgi:hypothetical protein